MTICRTREEIEAAARANAAGWPPITQAQADYVAALLAPYRELLAAHRRDPGPAGATGADQGERL
ncbi:MAG TPA: hypothetical protein VGH27_01590 [Streptosporangiaceae bacterium]